MSTNDNVPDINLDKIKAMEEKTKINIRLYSNIWAIKFFFFEKKLNSLLNKYLFPFNIICTIIIIIIGSTF